MRSPYRFITALVLSSLLLPVMAWRSTGNTNGELVANLASHGILKSEVAKAAMTRVDRANYVRDRSSAYEDAPQLRKMPSAPAIWWLKGFFSLSAHSRRIGHGATISAPHMHAYAAENLLPLLKPGAKVLDVGSGSGYLLAIFHHIVGESGKVVGIEHVPELANWSIENLRKDGLGDALDAQQIEVIVGDGRQGRQENGPYDAVHVGAAPPTVPPTLIEQLASPGRMFIPVGVYMQDVQQVDKDKNGQTTQQSMMSVSYVPLTDRDQQGDW